MRGLLRANGESHALFLKNLKGVLPKDRDVIIADAGFRTDFFVQVQANSMSLFAS